MGFHNPFLKDGHIRFPDSGNLVRHVEKWGKIRGDNLAYQFIDFSTERDGVAKNLSWREFSARNKAVGKSWGAALARSNRLVVTTVKS